MKSLKRSGILAIAAFLFYSLISVDSNAQGPWAQEKGKGYSQVVFNSISNYSSLYDERTGTGDTRRTERILSEVVLAAYGEFGINDKLTIGANIPFGMVKSGSARVDSIPPQFAEGRLIAFGNVSAIAKYTFIDKKWKAAFLTQVGLATAERDTSTGLATGVDTYSLQPTLSFGSSSEDWYYFGYFGYGYRTNDYHDYLTMGAEVGKRLSNDKILIIMNIHRLHNLGNGSALVDAPAIVETGLHTSFQEYSAFLAKIFVEDLYKGVGAFGSIGGAFPGEKVSVAAAPAMSLGLFYKW